MPATTPPSERGPRRCQERKEWTPSPLPLQEQDQEGSPEARPIICHSRKMPTATNLFTNTLDKCSERE